jgi:predicted transcriptional regulator of viral defense system
MTYLEFREQWHGIGCFNVYQIRAWNPEFDRSNLSRWMKRGYLSKLRQDWYAFCDLKGNPETARYVAQRIYTPSYISLHYALSFYGIIPEAVTDITCVTSNRTTTYSNDFGHFSYQTIKPALFFGFRQMPLSPRGSYLLAFPEKAIVDLLYLYPQYNTAEAMFELRLDEWWMQEDLDKERLMTFAEQSGNKALYERVKLLIKTYSE